MFVRICRSIYKLPTQSLLLRRLATQTPDLALKDTLKNELKIAMRAKDKLKVTVIKSVLADNITAEKSGSDKLPSFSELIQKGIKRRQDSVKEYRSGGRDDLAKSEEDELVILQSFLPKQMSKDELSKIVQETIDKVGAKDVKDLGKLMKVLNSELDVAVVSRKMISDVAKEILSSKSK